MIAVEGELDMDTATGLEHELEGPLEGGAGPVLLDLGRCEFIDSTGIALIVRTRQALDGSGSFALCGLSDQVKRVLAITGLEDTIPTHRDREQALAALRA